MLLAAVLGVRTYRAGVLASDLVQAVEQERMVAHDVGSASPQMGPVERFVRTHCRREVLSACVETLRRHARAQKRGDAKLAMGSLDCLGLDPEHVGIALTAAGIVTQTPAGWLVHSSAPSGG